MGGGGFWAEAWDPRLDGGVGIIGVVFVLQTWWAPNVGTK
jgi:hypothetical protein